MRCKEARLRVTEYALGDLAGEEARRLEEHLEACAACRAEWEEMSHTLGAIRSSTDLPDPGPAFWSAFPTRVRAGVGEMREARSRSASRLFGWIPRPLVLVPAGVLAAAIAVAGLALWPTPHDGKSSREAQVAPPTQARAGGEEEKADPAFAGPSWNDLDEGEAHGVVKALAGMLDGNQDPEGAGGSAVLLAGGIVLVDQDLDESAWEEVDRLIRSEYESDAGRG